MTKFIIKSTTIFIQNINKFQQTLRYSSQRRNSKRWRLLPNHGQEAFTRTGNRRTKQPSLHIFSRQRRSQSHSPRRSFPRQKPFWTNFLQ